MVVPNYVPDPLEVPGNVAQEPIGPRLRFVRRVHMLHLASLLTIFGLSMVVKVSGPGSLGYLAMLVSALLVSLVLIRAMLRGKRLEIPVSLLAFLPLLGASAAMGKRLVEAGFPAWAVLPGVVAATIYALLSGRDHSFVGQFILSLLASSAGIVGFEVWRRAAWTDMGASLSINACFLFFVVYDAASLLSRRRLGEEWGAAIDLYRDLLNWLGYIPRVILHWRRHRIFEWR